MRMRSSASTMACAAHAQWRGFGTPCQGRVGTAGAHQRQAIHTLVAGERCSCRAANWQRKAPTVCAVGWRYTSRQSAGGQLRSHDRCLSPGPPPPTPTSQPFAPDAQRPHAAPLSQTAAAAGRGCRQGVNALHNALGVRDAHGHSGMAGWRMLQAPSSYVEAGSMRIGATRMHGNTLPAVCCRRPPWCHWLSACSFA